MVTRKLLAASLLCIGVLSSSLAFSGDDLSQRAIPIDAPTGKAVLVHVDDSSKSVDRSFNTPTDDGRPGEYFFALGVQAVKKGDYEHAMAMYKVSASWAYKPAEYNLGVMYLSGQGTPVDLPHALAWMALAAERNDPQYVRARQLVYQNMTPEQYQQANVIWRELLPTYGDEHALARAKSRWREALSDATGSRVGSSAAPVQVGGVDGTASHIRSANYDVHNHGHVGTTAVELVGAHKADGATAYQTLRTSDNPYDPKVMPVSGQVQVGDVSTVDAKEGAATQDKSKGGDGHP